MARTELTELNLGCGNKILKGWVNLDKFPLEGVDVVYDIEDLPLPFDSEHIAKQVARALPEGCLLYIKPHPHYCGSDIPISKAIELSKIPNARLISHKISLKELLNKCYGIICVSATTGFEGIVNDKPVFVFGRPFYAVDGTVIFVDNLMELPYLLSKVINDPHYGTSIKSRKNLIAKYYAHQIPLESKPSSNLNMYVTDSEAKEIASHIIQAFEYLE